MRTSQASPSAGFSLLEVVIALALVVLVGTAATGSLQGGLHSLSGAGESAKAIDAMREFREFTFNLTLAEVDLLDGQKVSPIMGDGSPLPGAENLLMAVTVEAVSDNDPTYILPPGTPGVVRRITTETWSGSRRILEATWLSSAR